MFEKIHISNFRCFEDFELDLKGMSSCVLLGRNGAGKSSIGAVVELLQRMAARSSRVGDLIELADAPRDSLRKVRFEIVARLSKKEYVYAIVLELPARFEELRVAEESLTVDDEKVFERKLAQVTLYRSKEREPVGFAIDWHVPALPIVQAASNTDPIAVLKKWLSEIIVLRPIPSLMRGGSDATTLIPKPNLENFGDWFSGLLVSNPAAYEPFSAFLKEVMPDLLAVRNPGIGPDSRAIFADFGKKNTVLALPFDRLSDGEKCFFASSLLIAAASTSEGLTCFWDEPDNYLAPQEIASTMIALRRAFSGSNQILITSHNPASIKRFSDENTILIYRQTHLVSPQAKRLDNVRQEHSQDGDALDQWLRGDLEP
jgi:ABC-type cobalamin/Fe3+-siderophores transport system ATPase subunit